MSDGLTEVWRGARSIDEEERLHNELLATDKKYAIICHKIEKYEHKLRINKKEKERIFNNYASKNRR